MKNYRDLSTQASDVSAGFQFEFYCERCDETWRSPFVAYRRGQVTGWLLRGSWLLTEMWKSHYWTAKAGRGASAFADAGSTGAKQQALQVAIEQAKSHFNQCSACHKWVGDECFDENTGLCVSCGKAGGQGRLEQGGSADAGSAALACPNCQTPSQGGRFCHECGFDMASTHKSCPSCGATQPRSARFCGDCGHGF